MSRSLLPQRCDDDGGGDDKPCMNIGKAWGRGYTGKGVVVSVLDDAIDEEHPDLKPNYVSAPRRRDGGAGKSLAIWLCVCERERSRAETDTSAPGPKVRGAGHRLGCGH